MAGFLDALRAFFNPAPGFEPFEPIGEAYRIRGVTADDLWGPSADAWREATTSGERVDAETAMRTIAVQAAVRLLVNDIGSLPVHSFRREGKGRTPLTLPSWVKDPDPGDPNMEWEDHIKQVTHSLVTSGHAFTRCHPSRFSVAGIESLNPDEVDIDTFRGQTVYPVRGYSAPLTPAEVVSIPWILAPGKKRGMNPIEAARQGLGIAIAADKFVGSYFGNGAILSGVIEFPAGAEPDAAQVTALKADFARKHVGARKSHAVGALTGGATFKPFDYNNRDAQLLELRESIVEDVARLFGIPPHMLGSQKPGAVGYASVEQRSIDYTAHAVLPITRRIQKGYSRLLRGPETYLKLDLRGLLAGDAQSRAAYYNTLLQNKVIRRDEVRELEDFDFDEQAVGYLETPNNNPPDAPDAPADPAQEPADASD